MTITHIILIGDMQDVRDRRGCDPAVHERRREGEGAQRVIITITTTIINVITITMNTIIIIIIIVIIVIIVIFISPCKLIVCMRNSVGWLETRLAQNTLSYIKLA